MFQRLTQSRSVVIGLTLLALIVLFQLVQSPEAVAGGWITYPNPGSTSVTPMVGDFDGDGLHDLGYFNNGSWYYKASNTGNWYPPVVRSLTWSEPARIKDNERGYGKDVTLVTGFGNGVTLTIIIGDYDGDLKDDPGYIYDTGTNLVFKYAKSSASYAVQTYNMPTRYTSYTAFVADIDGDGQSDPMVYDSTGGVIQGLKSSNMFSNSAGQYFSKSTGYTGGKPFVVDYDNGLSDPNDKTATNWTKGRDFLDDLALLSGTNVYIWSSHYGAFDLSPVTLGSLATSTDTPVTGDFDGDGIKDVAVYRPGSGQNGGQFRVLKSSNNFSTSNITTYNLGSTDTTDVPVPGRYDVDFTTDFAVYRQGAVGTSEWHVFFSADYTDYPTNGVLNSGGAYPDPRFGAAMASWNDLTKQCYETEFGWPSNGPTPFPSPTGALVTPTPFAATALTPPANTDIDNDGYPGGAKIPCGYEAIIANGTPQAIGANILDSYRFDNYRAYYNGVWYPTNPVNEMAQTFTDGVKYKFNPRAFNVSYGNYLDPRANSLLPFFKYVKGQNMWSTDDPTGERPDLPTEHPGAIMVWLDGNAPFHSVESGNRRVGVRTLYPDPVSGSYIYKRADFKQWLIDNRQGPLKDPRRWYNLIALAEVENSAKLQVADYVAILKDYTTLLDEARDSIKTDYGLSVYPILTLSGLQGPSTNSAINWKNAQGTPIATPTQVVGQPIVKGIPPGILVDFQVISESAPPATPTGQPTPTPGGPTATPTPTPLPLLFCWEDGTRWPADEYTGSLSAWPTPGSDGIEDSKQLPNWRVYYREVLKQMNTTGTGWTTAQKDTWHELFAFASLDPYYGPLDGLKSDTSSTVDALDVDADGNPAGGSYHTLTYKDVERLARAHADRMRCAARIFWEDAEDTTISNGRGRPSLVQQFGAIIYTEKRVREGWAGAEMPVEVKNTLMASYARPTVGASTPTPAKPYCFSGTGVSNDSACQGAGGEANQNYGVRTASHYSSALATQLIMKDLMEDGWGNLGAVAYWLTIDEPRHFDYMKWWTWGDLYSGMEPLMDQGDGGTLFLTPTGRVWLAGAAGKSGYTPPSPYWFQSNGVNGAGANTLKSVYALPGWYVTPTPKP